MHQSMIFPTIAKLIKSIEKYLLEGLPFMKSKLVRNYLKKSLETEKVRMKRPRKEIRSTRAIPEDRVTYSIPTIEYPDPHLIPNEEAPTGEYPARTVNHVFCFYALVE